MKDFSEKQIKDVLKIYYRALYKDKVIDLSQVLFLLKDAFVPVNQEARDILGLSAENLDNLMILAGFKDLSQKDSYIILLYSFDDKDLKIRQISESRFKLLKRFVNNYNETSEIQKFIKENAGQVFENLFKEWRIENSGWQELFR